jgi:hypothetical protein
MAMPISMLVTVLVAERVLSRLAAVLPPKYRS